MKPLAELDARGIGALLFDIDETFGTAGKITAQAYGADPHNPAQNVEAGAAYLRELLIKYNGDPHRALAAYNAGPGAVDKYNGVPPYAETQTYVERVLRKYKKSTDSEAGQ